MLLTCKYVYQQVCRSSIALQLEVCESLLCQGFFLVLEKRFLQISSELLDWTDPHPSIGRFDVLIACDVLYEKEAVQPMAALVAKLISKTGGRFILADPVSRTKVHRYDSR